MVRFHDDLVEEGYGVAELALEPEIAVRLIRILDDSLRIEAEVAPYLYQSHEPAEVLVARVDVSHTKPLS